jgi:hypothetical protein
MRSRLAPEAIVALQVIRYYINSSPHPWEAKIGFIIPRVPHFDSAGDASQFAGGGYSRTLQFWFQVRWSDRVVHCATRLHPSQVGFLHINMLEFFVLILEVAATIQFLHDLTPEEELQFFPNGRPVCPLLFAKADNTSGLAWLNKATSTTPQGQLLIPVYSALLRLEEVGVNGEHIAGALNDQADMISRPSDLTLSPCAMAQQLFQMYPIMRTWRRFLPSPELQQLLYSSLFTPPAPTPLDLPKRLGHFVPAESIISCLPTI